MSVTVVAQTLDLSPVALNICISRGDSRPFTIQFLESDATTPRDLSGVTTATLTVSSVRTPVGGTPVPEFALVGVIVGANVTWTPTTSQMDLTAKKYYFDVQFASPVFTEVKGEFLVGQDIDKT